MANYVNNNNNELRNVITLGVDQSFSHTGLVVSCKNGNILAAKGINTDTKNSIESRINLIKNVIVETIKEYNVKQVVIEGLSYASNQASGRQLGGLFYVILCAFNELNISYTVVPPLTLKKAITDNGKATKDEMIKAISPQELQLLSTITKLKITSKKFEDIADAYHLSRYLNICNK